MIRGHWWHPSVRLWNTATNLAFPLVGLIVGVNLGTARAWEFAARLAVLGACSAAYHWYGGTKTRALDWFGMFFAIYGLAAFAADPTGIQVEWWMVTAAAGLSALLLTYVFKQVGKEPVLAIGMALVCFPVAGSGNLLAIGFGVVSLALFAVGLVFQRRDKRQGHKGHGWWHILASLGFGAMLVAVHLTGVRP